MTARCSFLVHIIREAAIFTCQQNEENRCKIRLHSHDHNSTNSTYAFPVTEFLTKVGTHRSSSCNRFADPNPTKKLDRRIRIHETLKTSKRLRIERFENCSQAVC
ncbi:hypothetical protein AVEN_224403-1 [Araneus ventricosus]|uniref:Uncharacterized protein n=1 Tax=Araneus ventricosus TaxID=182803 RepID=A0A4Y2V0D2_ARAVE|nr:hypothetical protein AVEN_274488-1 [Araneus ventricosus]GBO17360.1 hypothetical protein AVEN_224403-1 [Araneus ventricosus]